MGKSAAGFARRAPKDGSGLETASTFSHWPQLLGAIQEFRAADGATEGLSPSQSTEHIAWHLLESGLDPQDNRLCVKCVDL